MFRCNANKRHLLLGLLFLLQRHMKAVLGDTSATSTTWAIITITIPAVTSITTSTTNPRTDTPPGCTTNECSYDSLPPILGKGVATFTPQKSCYVDTEHVIVTCKGDLRGPPYNICTSGYWLYPSGPTCEADCLTPVLDNGSVSPDTPTVRNGEVITFECDKNFTKIGLSVTTCRDGHFDPPELPVCYAQCSRKDIPNSDSSSSSPIHHGEVMIITCDEGYSSGQENSTSSACSNGIFSPPLPTCYADCKSLKDPDYGKVVLGSLDPYYHREVAVFQCNGNYTLVGSQEIYCYDGLWDKDPPVCMASCSRPVIHHSDAISPNPLVPHGIAIIVTCDKGYTNSDAARTTLICEDGTLFPDEPKCIGKTMKSYEVASIVLGVLGTVLGLAAIICDIYLDRKRRREYNLRPWLDGDLHPRLLKSSHVQIRCDKVSSDFK